MARELIQLCAYKVGPSANNLTTPKLVPFNKGDIGNPVLVSNNGVRWGSVLKPTFKRSGTHKVQVFETPEQINTQIDPATAGADAALTVSAAGTTQGAGTAITRYLNVVTTITAASAEAVTLPAATVGKIHVITNADAADTLKVFPASGDFIDPAAVDASVNLLPSKTATFACLVADHWTRVDW